MDNLTYEYFISRCWNCPRYKHGADSGIWERLLIDYSDAKNSDMVNAQSSQTKYDKKLAEVTDYLDKAFNKLISIAKNKRINQDVINELEESRRTINESDEPQVIIDILKITTNLINEYSICPFPKR